MQNLGRRIDKHRTHHDEQQHGEDKHHILGGLAQIFTDELRQTDTAIAHRQHAGKVVVRGSCKDAAEDNPQIGDRAELGTHDGTEDGTRTGNVQELNHKDLPVGKDNIVNTIGLGNSRSDAIVRGYYFLNEAPIEHITKQQSD